MRSLIIKAVCFFLGLFLMSCTSVKYSTDPDLIGYSEHGKASFYAMKFQFRKTASGERFNQFSKTAAHRKLPFGTKI